MSESQGSYLFSYPAGCEFDSSAPDVQDQARSLVEGEISLNNLRWDKLTEI